MLRKLLILSIVICCAHQGFCQVPKVKVYAGTMHYMGDLSPFDHPLSFSQGHFATGVSYTLVSNEIASYFVRFMHGKVSGNDALSASISRQQRNLSFESNIDEFGVGVEISLISLMPKLKKYGLDVYLTAGTNIFHFNPKAYYQGGLVELQPLGTEGQGSSVLYKAPYKRWQINFPIGAGANFQLSPAVSMAIEVTPRILLTDYLDDVSSDYVGTSQQIQSQGLLTTALANRMGELATSANEPEDFIVTTGQQRGNVKDKDRYFFSSIHFISNLGDLKKLAKKLKRN